MLTRLTRSGDKWVLVIDEPILNQLQIDPEKPVELTTNGQVITIAPARDAACQSSFEAALERVNRDYGRALKKLVE